MTERAPDPRSARTVEALRVALRGSVLADGLDAVTVSALCRAAEVRRTTFYTHFSSAADLLTQMLTAEVDDLLATPDTTSMTVEEVAEEYHTALTAAFEAIAADRPLFRAAFDSAASAPLHRSLSAMFAERLEVALDIWHAYGRALTVDAPIAVAFSAGALTASVEYWAHSDDTDAARAVAAVRDQMPPWWPRLHPAAT